MNKNKEVPIPAGKKRRQPRMVSVSGEKPAEGVNCFTLAFDGIGSDAKYVITEGILVTMKSSSGAAVPLGNDRGEFHMVLPDRYVPPMFSAVDDAFFVFSASSKEVVSVKTKRRHVFLTAPVADDDCVIVKVETGHDGIVSFSGALKKASWGQKCFIETVRDGNVKHISSGSVVSRTGVVVSKEYLFRICEGGTIVAHLANGWKRRISYSGDKFFKVDDITYDDAIQSSLVRAEKGADFGERNSGRHGLIDLIEKTGYDCLWDLLLGHLQSVEESDVSNAVLERIIALCPDSERRMWALNLFEANAAKKRAFSGKPPAFVDKPSGSSNVVSIKNSAEERKKREARLAERRSRDQKEREEAKARPRPGQAANNYQQKKEKGKK